jgi:hypothetical protein
MPMTTKSEIQVIARLLGEGAEKPMLEEVVDADLAAFEDYFCGELKNASLAKPERAILKTYLFFKLVVEPKKHET